jgi:hypothetical protein
MRIATFECAVAGFALLAAVNVRLPEEYGNDWKLGGTVGADSDSVPSVNLTVNVCVELARLVAVRVKERFRSASPTRYVESVKAPA